MITAKPRCSDFSHPWEELLGLLSKLQVTFFAFSSSRLPPFKVILAMELIIFRKVGKLQWIQNDRSRRARTWIRVLMQLRDLTTSRKLKRGMRRSDRNSMSNSNFRGIIAYCLFDDIFEKHDVLKMIVLVIITLPELL